MVTLTLLHPQSRTPLNQWSFPSATHIRIGRSTDNHIVLLDILVSRYHLEICREDLAASSPSWQLRNLGTNGTFLDGKLIHQGVLSSGSLIQLGLTGPLLQFECRSEALEAAPEIPCVHVGNRPGNLFCVQCGAPLNVLRQVRHYQILRILGKGGMGTTALAWTPATEHSPSRLQVLKELNKEMIPVPKARELFQREGRVLQALDHDQIPTVYDAFAEGERLYLAMEMIHGRSLAQWVSRHGPVPPAQAIDWMLQVCEVLTYLHGCQPPIIHRDLKPSNLLIRIRDRQICVIDFGVVKEFSLDPGTYISAEGYSPPEQRLGNPTPQSDLYAVGATLVFLLTGQHPGEFHKNLDLGYRIDVSAVTQIPVALQAVITQATHPHLPHRYLQVEDLARALQDCLKTL